MCVPRVGLIVSTPTGISKRKFLQNLKHPCTFRLSPNREAFSVEAWFAARVVTRTRFHWPYHPCTSKVALVASKIPYSCTKFWFWLTDVFMDLRHYIYKNSHSLLGESWGMAIRWGMANRAISCIWGKMPLTVLNLGKLYSPYDKSKHQLNGTLLSFAFLVRYKNRLLRKTSYLRVIQVISHSFVNHLLFDISVLYLQ